MSLLSAGQLTQIKNALRSVTDTFEVDVTLMQRSTKFTAFNDNREDYIVQEITVKALAVYGGEGQQVSTGLKGSDELSEGYMLFNMDTLDESGLLNADGFPVFELNKDTFKYQGAELEILEVIPLGPLDGYRVCKVFWKRKL